MQPSKPVCAGFIVCDAVVEFQGGEFNLHRLTQGLSSGVFPLAQQLGMFCRLTSAQGDYTIEIHLRAMDGQVVWRGGLPQTQPLPDPREIYDLKMNLKIVFPKPGRYHIVLLANEAEIAKQVFSADFDRHTGRPVLRNERVHFHYDSARPQSAFVSAGLGGCQKRCQEPCSKKVPDTFSLLDTATYTVSDGTVSASAFATFSVAPAGAVSAVVPGFLDASENSSLAIGGVFVQDVNSNAGTTTVTFTVGHGTLSLEAVDNATISGNNTNALSVTAPVAALDTVLATSGGLLYTPVSGYTAMMFSPSRPAIRIMRRACRPDAHHGQRTHGRL